MKEHGCIYGLMNGANSDNDVSIQKMVTPNMQHCSETSIQLGPGHYCMHKITSNDLYGPVITCNGLIVNAMN